MRQAEMFQPTGYCPHTRWVEAKPVEYEDCVNVDQMCTTCGKVETVSWTKEAWSQKHGEHSGVKRQS